MRDDLLARFEAWFEGRKASYEALGLEARLTHGVAGRDPASVLMDLETPENSARLIFWSNGQADLMAGDLVGKEILVDEHREISDAEGFEAAERRLLSCFV